MQELTRDTILAAKDINVERVDVPEWDGFVHVRTLTGEERDSFEQRAVNARHGDRIDLRGLKAHLVALALCDKDGNRIIETPEQVKQLGQKSAAALDRLFTVAQRMAGLSDEDVQELSDNFQDRPNGSSGSA